MKKDSIVQIIWFVVILGLFIFSLKMLRSGELEAGVASFGLWAPAIFLVLKAMTLIIAPLGGSPLYLIAGALFGGVYGFILSLLGDAAGSIGCFAISRKFGDRVVKRLAGEKFFSQIKKFVGLLGNTKSFIKARITLLNLPEVVAYAAGLSPINFWKFIFWQMVFFVPGVALLVFFGSQMAVLSAKYFFLFPLFLIVIAAIGTFSLYKDYEKMEGM